MTLTEERRHSSAGHQQYPSGSHERRGWFVYLAVAVAAVVGFGGGWLAFGGDDTVEPEQVEPAGQVVGAAQLELEQAIRTGGFRTGTYLNQDDGRYITLRFSEDGTYVHNIDGYSVRGVYVINGSLLTDAINDRESRTAPATYRWRYDAGTLSFELVGQDTQPMRKNVYIGATGEGRVYELTK
ncbi:MAG TPA: hypothetical protein VIS05_08575 [Ilumatobacter sp.]